MDGRSRSHGVQVAEHAVSRAARPRTRRRHDRRRPRRVRTRRCAVTARRPAVLVLEDGSVFRGDAFGAEETVFGEVVFNTAMTGYQEILTDPSYCGQIVAMTAPQIGNTGVNREDFESGRVFASGFVVRELAPLASNWRAEGDLASLLADAGVAGITGVDTRALTRRIRDRGAQRGAIATGDVDVGELRDRVLASPSMEGRDLVPQVTCAERYTWDEPTWRPPDAPGAPPPPAELHVVAYDFGIKRNILRDLRDAGIRVTVVPATTPAADALALAPDGVFLSNGPGDPAAVTYAVDAVRDLVASGVPLFGICLGHQILALALGGRTYKLPFGHHGANHPVLDLATGKVEITSQNHGFCVDVDSLAGRAICTHLNLYDRTVEGLRVAGKPVFGVQYHPEASPGPHDSAYLFARFAAAMRGQSA
ncbi:MAG: carbamoyl-phosphate synthase small subunit [Deltaproteobacteria bacterium]|nr:MAG: carbamoyl-phosphate synthase small subunit [Deltaproteobacteria bacterium]